MGLSRRSLFGVGAGVLAASAIRAEAAPTPVTIPGDYEIGFELLTPWDNLYYEVEEQDENGFVLEISVSSMKGNDSDTVPYRGAIRWWLMRHADDDEKDAFLSGVARSVIQDSDYHGELAFVRANFSHT